MNAVYRRWVVQQPTTGNDDDVDDNTMKRASISRRNEELGSPSAAVPRSRSTERSLENFDDHDAQEMSLESAPPTDPTLSPRTSLQRAMSDPFDAVDDEDIDYSPYHHNEPKDGIAADAAEILTTLPRFPVSETRDKVRAQTFHDS